MSPLNPVSIFAPPLNQAGLRWMTVGSIAANAYGEFRVTNDVDLVLVMNRGEAAQLAAAFREDEFYRPPLEVMELEAARAQRGHFNLFITRPALKKTSNWLAEILCRRGLLLIAAKRPSRG